MSLPGLIFLTVRNTRRISSPNADVRTAPPRSPARRTLRVFTNADSTSAREPSVLPSVPLSPRRRLTARRPAELEILGR